MLSSSDFAHGAFQVRGGPDESVREREAVPTCRPILQAETCRFFGTLPVIEGMRRHIKNLCLAALLLLFACALGASAQSSGGPYRIAPVAVANGGGSSAAVRFN